MTDDSRYFAADLGKEADQERLTDLELTWDPITIRHLEMLGVSPGWKCLDVGAGYGSITAWLANRVGPQGKIVATDIRSELHRDTSDNIEVRQHNILTDELECDYYDLVHCRSVLTFVGEPEKALSNMAKALKPGGWLLIEELDILTIPPFDTNNPDADFYYRFMHKGSGIQLRLKYIDVEFGRNVRWLVEQLGFQDIGCEGITLIVRGGEPWAKMEAMTYKTIAERLKDELIEEEKKLIEEGFDKVQSLLDNPSFYYVCSPLFCAWGRKPI